MNTLTFCTLPAWKEPSSRRKQEDAVEVAHRLRLVGDDDGQRVEAVLGIDGDERVARLLDALADVARELGAERQVEHGDERDDGQREQDA